MKNFLSIFILILGAQAFASGNEFSEWKKVAHEDLAWSRTFQTSAVYSIHQILLQRQGQVGGFDLYELEKLISNVHWLVVEDLKIAAGPEGRRSSATYSVVEKLVVISLDEWRKMDVVMQYALCLHEALGALGYHDENYTISTAITTVAMIAEAKNNSSLLDSQLILSKMPELSLKVSHDRSVYEISKTDVTPTYKVAAGGDGGGSTGIGGGGDEIGISVKLTISLIFMARWQTAHPPNLKFDDVFSAVLSSDVERTAEVVANNGKALIDNTKVSLDQKGLHVIVPRNDIILRGREVELAQLYMAYVCDEIIHAFSERK